MYMYPMKVNCAVTFYGKHDHVNYELQETINTGICCDCVH